MVDESKKGIEVLTYILCEMKTKHKTWPVSLTVNVSWPSYCLITYNNIK